MRDCSEEMSDCYEEEDFERMRDHSFTALAKILNRMGVRFEYVAKKTNCLTLYSWNFVRVIRFQFCCPFPFFLFALFKIDTHHQQTYKQEHSMHVLGQLTSRQKPSYLKNFKKHQNITSQPTNTSQSPLHRLMYFFYFFSNSVIHFTFSHHMYHSFCYDCQEYDFPTCGACGGERLSLALATVALLLAKMMT